MSSKKQQGQGRERTSVLAFIHARLVERPFEAVVAILAKAENAGADFVIEAIKPGGWRVAVKKDEIALAVGFGGKHGIDFDRDGGRQVPGSMLRNLAKRDEFSDAERQVLNSLATFLEGYEEGTVPSDLGIAGLVGSFHNVVQNHWSKFYVRQFRGAFRNWWEAQVRRVHDALESEEIYNTWAAVGQGKGAVVGSAVTPGTLRHLFRDYGLDFVVIQDDEGKVTSVLWEPSASAAALVDSAVTEHLGRFGAEGEYAKWDGGALPNLGLRNRYPVDGYVTGVAALAVFEAIMAKITDQEAAPLIAAAG